MDTLILNLASRIVGKSISVDEAPQAVLFCDDSARELIHHLYNNDRSCSMRQDFCPHVGHTGSMTPPPQAWTRTDSRPGPHRGPRICLPASVPGLVWGAALSGHTGPSRRTCLSPRRWLPKFLLLCIPARVTWSPCRGDASYKPQGPDAGVTEGQGHPSTGL